MKEATGELNMTVVTIVAIGALVAFFYLVIWPAIKTSMTLTSACNSAGSSSMTFYDDDGNETVKCEAANGVTTCSEVRSDGSTGSSKTCD